MKRILMVGACALGLAACSGSEEASEQAANESAEAPAVLVSGIGFDGFDNEVRPQDDFFAYVNGGWIKNTEIPGDQSSFGSFNILRNQSEEHQRLIIEELGATEGLEAGSEVQKIGDLYASLMNAELAEELGVEPLRPSFDAIGAAESHDDIIRLFTGARRRGIGVPVMLFVNNDFEDSNHYIAYMTQSGLGLPNRNFYLQDNPKFAAIRERYPLYIAELFELAGFDNGAARALSIYDLEMKIAEAHWAPEENRDASRTNNKVTVGDLGGITDQINWTAFLEEAGMGEQTAVVVRQPSYVEAFGAIFAETPVSVWQDYLTFHVINNSASNLSTAFVDARFEFFSKMIRGLKEQPARWKRSVRSVNRILGDAVGKVYVERYFPPEAKERMDELVGNLLVAFEVSINGLEWMSDETKERAQAKRENFTTKIGYPERWKDYADLEISRDDPVGNLRRSAMFSYEDGLAKLSEEARRWEWGMTPQTVNAYHNPRMNEIVFPAAILQPPFFNLEADDAVNYGGIGAVIGHEVGHAFDDQGRKYDPFGNLNDWWTEADADAFTAKAEAMVDQYNAFEPLEGLNVNGQLTLGENIGDFTGLAIGYLAYQMSLDGEEAPVIDGLTGDQRFIIGFAQIWRVKMTEEAMRLRITSDPHSPGEFRTNGPLSNFTPFYEIFGVKEGDGMYRPPEERVSIW